MKPYLSCWSSQGAKKAFGAKDDAPRASIFVQFEPERAGKGDVLERHSVAEKRRDVGIVEACDATADARDVEVEVGVLAGEVDEFVNIGAYGLYPTLHCWDGVALPLQSNALSHAKGDKGGSSAVHALKITAKDEDFARLKRLDAIWCDSVWLHLVFWFFENTYRHKRAHGSGRHV